MNLCKSCGIDGLRPIGLGGLGGIVCDDMGCYDDGTGQVAPVPSGGTFTDYTTGTTYVNTGAYVGAGSYPTTITPTATNTTNATTSGVSTASAISSIAAAFSNIFKTISPLPAGCTQVAGPYGTSTQCVGSQNTPTSTLSLTSLTSSLGSSSGILLIGGVVILIMMMKK